jgi:alkyl hydroperoxide reductase subunit D
MTIEQLKNALPDYAKDIKLNLQNVLYTVEGSDLTQHQIYNIALACAFATRNKKLIAALLIDTTDHLSAQEIESAKSAATIMAMNNIYYRFTHSVSDKSYSTMPAKLRMNVIGNPGIDKVLFELECLAISAINGCAMCMNAHTMQVEKAGLSKTAVHSAIRIAAVIQATTIGLEIAE